MIPFWMLPILCFFYLQCKIAYGMPDKSGNRSASNNNRFPSWMRLKAINMKTLINKAAEDAIKSSEQCQTELTKLFASKPAQFAAVMKMKLALLENFYNYYSNNDAEKEAFVEIRLKYVEFLKELYDSLKKSPLTMESVRNLDRNAENILEFGEFQITKWYWDLEDGKSKKLYMFHRKNDAKFKELAKLLAPISQKTKGQLLDFTLSYWHPLEVLLEHQIAVLRKTDTFACAFTGVWGRYRNELDLKKPLDLVNSKDIRLANLMLRGVRQIAQLDGDIVTLNEVRKFLAKHEHVKIRYQTGLKRSHTGITSSKPNPRRHETNPDENVVINEEIHDSSFFENLFAPYLEEFFQLLSKDGEAGGLFFQLTTRKKNGHRVLAVEIIKFEEYLQVGKKNEDDSIMPQYNGVSSAESFLDQQNKSKSPLHLESQLLTQLLMSLYAKIVDKMESLGRKKRAELVRDPRDLTLIFHAYTHALASELFKRMGEINEKFYDVDESLENDIPISPLRETELEKEQTRRWENLQKLQEKVELKKLYIFNKMTEIMPNFFNHMGYSELDAKALADAMEAEMSVTLDNLEVNWAVDCKVDSLEECLFEENRDLDFDMPEMSLFPEGRSEFSKVQRFFDWIYRKLQRRMHKMDKQFLQSNNVIHSFFLKHGISMLDHLKQLMENRIDLADFFIPFYTELKMFVAKPAANAVKGIYKDWANMFDEIGNIANMYGGKESVNLLKSAGSKMHEIFIQDRVEISRQQTLSSSMKIIFKFMLNKLGIVQHMKNFRFTKMSELSELFSKLRKRMRIKKQPKSQCEENVITARTGKRKDWESKTAHKIAFTLVVDAAYKTINIMVFNGGNAARWGISTGFFFLTVLYMAGIIWLCRHLLWSITCIGFAQCGHYIAVGFAIMASAVWIAVMVISHGFVR